MRNSLILLELNEINFDIAKLYIKQGRSLPGFKRVMEGNFISTFSENEYDKIEPWIQWASIHTGKTFEEHRLFRLGDIEKSNVKQIFEHVESKGFSVGAISPMNTKNNLNQPAYFVPDPWTKTSTDGTFLSKIIHHALSQTVNDNSKEKISIKSFFYFLIACLTCLKLKDLISLFFYGISCLKLKHRRALFLDKLIFKIHQYFFIKKSPHFSTIFLNGGAHIQHHYFFNSKILKKRQQNPSWYIKGKFDPILDMLIVYDEILLELLNQKKSELIIATGLSQKPYDQNKFYYRLKDHKNFLNSLGIKFNALTPRMTRDFHISFDSDDEALKCKKVLESLEVDELKLFGEVEKKEKNLFVSLTYPKEISKKSFFKIKGKKIFLKQHVVFVALKNGMHQSKGFAFFSKGFSSFALKDGVHVKNFFHAINNFFDKAR